MTEAVIKYVDGQGQRQERHIDQPGNPNMLPAQVEFTHVAGAEALFFQVVHEGAQVILFESGDLVTAIPEKSMVAFPQKGKLGIRHT